MNPGKLETLTGAVLLSISLPPTRMIVESLVPQGLHILGGAPKIGKSWLTLWLCLRIAQGEPVWNLPTERGDTLYLCLEDSFARVQNRLLDFTEDAPDTIHFATMSETIAGGLVKQIETFLADHPATNFIAIDTLQRVRDATGEANAYANDYREVNVLKSLTDKHRIAILLIHHLRKQADDDPLNMISGTTGLTSPRPYTKQRNHNHNKLSKKKSIELACPVLFFCLSRRLQPCSTHVAESIEIEHYPHRPENLIHCTLKQNFVYVKVRSRLFFLRQNTRDLTFTTLVLFCFFVKCIRGRW